MYQCAPLAPASSVQFDFDCCEHCESECVCVCVRACYNWAPTFDGSLANPTTLARAHDHKHCPRLPHPVQSESHTSTVEYIRAQDVRPASPTIRVRSSYEHCNRARFSPHHHQSRTNTQFARVPCVCVCVLCMLQCTCARACLCTFGALVSVCVCVCTRLWLVAACAVRIR